VAANALGHLGVEGFGGGDDGDRQAAVASERFGEAALPSARRRDQVGGMSWLWRGDSRCRKSWKTLYPARIPISDATVFSARRRVSPKVKRETGRARSKLDAMPVLPRNGKWTQGASNRHWTTSPGRAMRPVRRRHAGSHEPGTGPNANWLKCAGCAKHAIPVLASRSDAA